MMVQSLRQQVQLPQHYLLFQLLGTASQTTTYKPPTELPDDTGLCRAPGFRRNQTDCTQFYRYTLKHKHIEHSTILLIPYNILIGVLTLTWKMIRRSIPSSGSHVAPVLFLMKDYPCALGRI